MGLVARVKGGAHRAKLALLPAGRRPMEGSALAPTWRFRDPKTGTTHRGLEPSVALKTNNLTPLPIPHATKPLIPEVVMFFIAYIPLDFIT